MTVNPASSGGFIPHGAVDLAALAQARQAEEKAAAARAARSTGGADGADGANDAASYVLDVSDATFQTEVLERSMTVPVVIDFWAEWCQPCKVLSPILERFAIEDGGSWVLAKVDVDASPQLSAAAQVQSIPTVLVVWQGQVIPGFAGALPEQQVRQFLDQVAQLSSTAPPAEAEVLAEPDPMLDAADEALARDDLDAAEKAYREILADQPDNDDARQGLASITLVRRTQGHDLTTARAAAEASGSVADHTVAADVELLNGLVEESFARLVELVRNSEGDDRDAAKDHLLGLLELVGNADPRVLSARRALASALF
jgi:putative thioredoxin